MKDYQLAALSAVYGFIEKKEELTIIDKKKGRKKQIAYSVVIEPETDVTEDGDLHGDVMDEEAIEGAAHSFMINGAKIKLQHKGKPIRAIVVENFISPIEYVAENGDTIKKGSWIIGIKVLSPSAWKAIEGGEITGVSPGGIGKVIPEK